jgi:hypothetical protein
LFARGQLLTLAVQKLKNRNATKNDIFQFDLQVESACALSDLNGLGRITSSIAIERLRVFTQPRPKADQQQEPVSLMWHGCFRGCRGIALAAISAVGGLAGPQIAAFDTCLKNLAQQESLDTDASAISPETGLPY